MIACLWRKAERDKSRLYAIRVACSRGDAERDELRLTLKQHRGAVQRPDEEREFLFHDDLTAVHDIHARRQPAACAV